MGARPLPGWCGSGCRYMYKHLVVAERHAHSESVARPASVMAPCCSEAPDRTVCYPALSSARVGRGWHATPCSAPAAAPASPQAGGRVQGGRCLCTLPTRDNTPPMTKTSAAPA